MELTIGLLVLLGIVLAFLAAINHTIKQAEKEDKKTNSRYEGGLNRAYYWIISFISCSFSFWR
ncbi:hypothetical protein ACLS0F_04625 [Avibacterium endocarditidis]|uniref:hypothetical protein n=1 Tax=Avibacterium endocarditidis TaxID=380674 RepID=UPI003BF89C27